MNSYALFFIVTILCLSLPLKGEDKGESIPYFVEERYTSRTVEWDVDLMVRKFFRGVTNIATSWIEIPRQMKISSITDNRRMAFTHGVTKGIFMTAIRLGSGVFDVATFPSAYPGEYTSLLDPIYPWQSLDNSIWEDIAKKQ